ncbi:MAG: response regulator [Myxococcaceae bacterium]|nr:response regulator [Myxococcaceae bacterium]
MSSSRDKLLAQFRELVVERLAKVNRFLMSLEAMGDPEAGKATLRELHGLKGEARMMGFAEVNTLVHQMEELVRTVEPLGYALGPGTVDALLVASDAVAVLAGATQGAPVELPRVLEWLGHTIVQEQARVAAGAPQPESAPASAPVPSAPPAPAGPTKAAPAAPPTPAPAPQADGRADATIRISQQSLEVLTSAVTSLQQVGRRRELAASRQRVLAKELAQLQRLAEDLGPAAMELVTRLSRAKEQSGDLTRLHTLIQTDEARELTVLSEEIQALRMLPLGVLFEPYPRMVRELSKDLGKEVELVVEGEDERVDRTVLDVLRDPLLHLVRNAIDHGLESREERVEAGKSPRGQLTLTARREGERLVLRVKDDGRGLRAADLKAVAVKKGLVDEATAAGLTELAAIDLVFLPGFTSKREVTDVSGRGVGLDVVKTRLAQIGGEVTVTSTPGLGAVFEVRAPLSLTVAPVLFVQTGDERFCLPAASVLRAVQVSQGQAREIAGKPTVVLDDQVLPYSSIASILGGAPERAVADGEVVLVVRGRGQTAAIGIDRVLDERTQAILPLRGLLARFAHLSGATQLPDGSLAMVLSAPHLVATAHGRELRLASDVSARAEVRKRRVLVVDDSPLTRELLVSLLESVGYEIAEAVDGAEALERLQREAVDLVVTDLEMPRVDGLELTRRLKGHPTLKSLPVVIVTTRGSDQDRRRGMEAGADGYVTKGDLVRQDLVDVVARLLA